MLMVFGTGKNIGKAGELIPWDEWTAGMGVRVCIAWTLGSLGSAAQFYEMRYLIV